MKTNIEPIDSIQIDIEIDGTFCPGYRATWDSPGEPDHFEDISIADINWNDVPGSMDWNVETKKIFLEFLNEWLYNNLSTIHEELLEDHYDSIEV